MKKKTGALALVIALCVAVALAGGDLCAISSEGATIAKLDSTARTMVVRTSYGKEMTVYWSEATKIEGTLKQGETVRIQASYKDGRIWASSLQVGPVKKAT